MNDYSKYASEEDQARERERQAHFAYDCGDECPYCNRQRCLNCDSDEFVRNGDIERCADCGK